MDFLAGVLLAIGIGATATWIGFDRDRAMYPVILIVIASYYVLFAMMAGAQPALMMEAVAAIAFLGAAIAGFRSSLWIVVLALAAHGVFDLVHGHVIDNPGVPAWWPMFCLAYDAAAAGYLAWLLSGRRVHARAT